MAAQHGTAAQVAASPLGPFRHRAFTIIWAATVIANVGTWMYNAASGWLMTGIDADPLTVSLVQVATNLPIFLFAMPAGALTDMIDKRRFLIFGESATTILSGIFALLVSMHLVNSTSLLSFMFLIGAAGALTAPAWQAIVPMLVPSKDLDGAVAANSVGVNISRAVGPALAGVMIVISGIAAPFWFNAISNLATVAALIWWRPPARNPHSLPPERLFSALRAGLRYAQHNSHLRATLVRAVAFFLFASAYWALLPLVARNQVAGGPALYGVLLGAIGAGAIGGAFIIPTMKARLGADRVMAAATVGTAIALALFGFAREPAVAVLASALAGCAWIAALASLNVSAQVALPDWVRGRGLAIYVTVFFGAMTAGSLVWGEVASRTDLSVAHLVAAAGILLAIPASWRWKLQTGAGVDLTPSLQWAAPVLSQAVENDRGPVLVTVEYRIVTEHRAAFLNAIGKLEHERRRDGAYAWGIFEDTAEPGRFLETFLVESWLEHLRQHQRVTNADRLLQDNVHRLLASPPKVRHLISAGRDKD